MYRMSPWLLVLATTALGPLTAQPTVPYTVSTVQGSNIISNYYDPNFPNSTGPGLPPSPVTNQFNRPLGKPLDSSAVAPIDRIGLYGGGHGMPPLGAPPMGGPPMGGGAGYGGNFGPGGGYPPIGSYPQGNGYAPQANFGPPPQYGGGPVRIESPPPQGFGGNSAGLGQPQEPGYTYPGMVARLGRQWVGSDYLYQMPGHIGVVVEVVHSTEQDLPIDEAGIKQAIMNLFYDNGIVPEALATANQPPLPFLHILILTSEVEKQTVAAVAARFFEKVSIDRFEFIPPGVWQAITWERQDLVIAPRVQLAGEVQRTAMGLATNFVDQINYFLELRIEQDSDIRRKRPQGQRQRHQGCQECITSCR